MPLVITAVGAVSVAALALLGVAVANAGAPAPAAGASVTLKTTRVGGTTLLTDADGRTLYWFSPDTATTSRCTGSCAAYWPPVAWRSKQGLAPRANSARIALALAGGLQATYDGHPLYTYIGDEPPRSGAGQQPRPQRRPDGHEARVAG